ncbi:zinc-ribbon domain-containing protein, partial [Desulfosporosinus metallidurans]|uniref:zinc-ribbon domain-containing protein n=1 Tax=Desulfosporosinus metallidurans TaxID=1888891 RepID=UPI000ABBAC1E
MICSKCGAENSEDSVFCNKCAANLSGVIEQEHKPKWFSNRRNIILSCSILVIGILVVVGIISFNNPVSVFKSNINNNKYVEATKTYDEKIKGNTDKEKSVNTFLKDDIAEIQKSFSESKIDYNT